MKEKERERESGKINRRADHRVKWEGKQAIDKHKDSRTMINGVKGGGGGGERGERKELREKNKANKKKGEENDVGNGNSKTNSKSCQLA